MQYDVEALKHNITEAVQQARKTLEQLETQQRLIEQHGESVLLVVDVLNKFGRVRTPKGDDAAKSNGKQTINQLVLSIVQHADAPLRANDVIAKSNGRLADRQRVATVLVGLSKGHLIKRMGAGLYWKIVEQEAPVIDGKVNMRSQQTHLIKAIEDYLQAHSDPEGTKTQEIIEAMARFPFVGKAKKPGIGRASAVKRALAASERIHLTGRARGARYHLK